MTKYLYKHGRRDEPIGSTAVYYIVLLLLLLINSIWKIPKKIFVICKFVVKTVIVFGGLDFWVWEYVDYCVDLDYRHTTWVWASSN